MEQYGIWIAGEERVGRAGERELMYVYDGSAFASQSFGDAADVEDALAAADGCRKVMAKLPALERSTILARSAVLLREQREMFEQMMVWETGKSVRDSRGEVGRAIGVLEMGAQLASHLEGDVIPMDAVPGGTGRLGIVKRVPIGVIGAITPFNFPLNLVCHKVVPAIATGNTVVLKPATRGCVTSILFARLLHEAGLPAGALNVVPGQASVVGTRIVEDPRVRMVSFTGSLPVALDIQRRAGLKKVAFELGGNAPNIVMRDADLEAAAAAVARGGFSGAGQSCISAQRIYVERPVFDAFAKLVAEKVGALKAGDPFSEDTDVGPMISEEEAARVEMWIHEATEGGARLLCGGTREGALMAPTVLLGAAADAKVVCQEVFGPVVTLLPFEGYDEAIALANASDFGLQAAIFTQDVSVALRAAHDIDAGGVWVNEVSAYRQDNYPYGGVKNSGIGTEGIQFAMEEMTHPKFIGIRYA